VLANPLSTLGDVAIEVVAATPGDGLAPRLRPALRRDSSGAVRLAYRSAADWSAPTAFVRIRNHTDRRLYGVCCAEKGTFRFAVRTRGKAGHASVPGVADNALLKLAPVIEKLGSTRPALRSGPLKADPCDLSSFSYSCSVRSPRFCSPSRSVPSRPRS